MTELKSPRLVPAQVCFVVDDVPAAVTECVAQFGWGPFHQFSVPVSDARYHEWSGAKRTDVALGMAGPVQVELVHVHEGHDTIEVYQSKYGTGFQHLGIYARNREHAQTFLESLGAVFDDRGAYEGIRFAFMDVPTGPGMFELLEATGESPPPGAVESDTQVPVAATDPIELDRATIATADLDEALRFFAHAFRWNNVAAELHTLRCGSSSSRIRRARGLAGKLLIELVEPPAGGDDPYSLHLARGEHGLVHAGGRFRSGSLPANPALECEWLEDGDAFALYDWAGGTRALQLRGARERIGMA